MASRDQPREGPSDAAGTSAAGDDMRRPASRILAVALAALLGCIGGAAAYLVLQAL